MSAVGFCGNWIIVTCDKKLFAVHTKEAREPFVFDCSTAEKKPKNTQDEKNRWVVRRCTSLVFTQAEDELLVADKSGDVYAFSVVEPQKEGELKMGHLSMLLALTVSLDDKYIITADRDEKIRVSHLRSPYNIQSFCLGHRQFVSALQILSTHPHWLLSGSGDGTLKLWDYESGSELQSCDLRQLDETTSSEADKDKDPTVCRVTSSTDGQYVAVQCDRVPILQLFTLTQKDNEKLVPHSRISLPCCPLDVNFDPEGRLWVLMDSSDAPLQIYSLTHSSWECVAHVPELNRVTKAFRPHWETLEASLRTNNRFEQLHKVTFDNVAVYLQKKQQRLEEQQLKRSGGQRAKCNKRAKKETEAVTQPFA
ncbi:tRNA (guanine-N(7)-)-methyltransferase non-catalytic subunit wdr4 isoform X3 [Oreochromis niloticus]|uniref:tRNA (guanine-N(7)-)-methyltransferase non-catalytic subunit wdr4 isoform X3 n=1 Tax=Oreochromis niloticus TaxID=8128 RepID=UPI000394173E|nr:tRNA (guanine-N(7)-)-methyltransferase non-catalytic subunit WDR4 isoform X3 [Oreochromis niloticus]XP_031586201.2 tRNA (guanine-N(7)-)-methyltransferase non-catalytic subunit wdr4 isoform X2 [Oreochromis aureus]